MYFVLYLSTDVNAIILSTPGVDHTPETMISKLPSRKAPITSEIHKTVERLDNFETLSKGSNKEQGQIRYAVGGEKKRSKNRNKYGILIIPTMDIVDKE